MKQHIDITSVLPGALCRLYSNLLTRPTGAAVRSAIEALLAERHPASVTTIDFSGVNLLDFSCADEIVAKLLLQHTEAPAGPERFVTFRGMRDDHLDAVEAVLERRALALVWEDGGRPSLLGPVSEDEARHWEVVLLLGPVWAEPVAASLGGTTGESAAVLDALWRRRLVMRTESGFMVPRGATGVSAA
jgi:hypothetical protein